MGWKNVKEHYRIGHIVRVEEGKICIGSPYVYDLITIGEDGEPRWSSTLGPSSNADLSRYFKEMTDDPATLKRLIAEPDTFERSITVYTYNAIRGEILEKQCEELGWPNVTHDGAIQYDNTFSADRDQVVAWAQQEIKFGIKKIRYQLAEGGESMKRVLGRLEKYEAAGVKLGISDKPVKRIVCQVEGPLAIAVRDPGDFWDELISEIGAHRGEKIMTAPPHEVTGVELRGVDDGAVLKKLLSYGHVGVAPLVQVLERGGAIWVRYEEVRS